MTPFPVSEAAPSGSVAPSWRGEPFRIFFPLGVVLGWVGISHWLLYAFGWIGEYSCELHGLIQMQAFTMAFALGFLMTAVPRRTQSAPPSSVELTLAVVLLLVITFAGLAQRWVAMDASYVALFLLLARFAVLRFRAGLARRRPPAAFLLVPFGVLQGIVGATLFAWSARSGGSASAHQIGKLLIQQGVFLSFVVGVGGLVMPLVGGFPPPADLGSSPRETRRALGYGALGLVIAGSIVAEGFGWPRAAPIARGVVVALGLAVGGGAWRRPLKPGFHRRLVWISMWLCPLGLILSGFFPDYRVPCLHVLFIGGFSLMAFAVATHVSFAHLGGLEHMMNGRHPAVVTVAAGIFLALCARLAADFSETYFQHLASAAIVWIAGSAVWLGYFGRKFLRP